MKSHFALILFIAFNAFFTTLDAQNVTLNYTHADALYACSVDTFFIDVSHNSNTPLTGAELLIDFPSGLQYASTSVVGAVEQNIANLSSPQFLLSDIAPGQVLRVSLIVEATCAAADFLDDGQLFIASISVNSSLGTTQINTNSMPVETGAIVIESITGQVLSGELGDTLLRRICVRNTRLGSIGALFFEDSHPEGISVWVAGAQNPFSTSTQYSAEFSNTIFQSVGNGDLWLDAQESVCFDETVVVTACGIPPFVNPSLLRVGWGCGGEICRYDSATAQVEIMPSTKNPQLEYTPIWAPFRDYCGNSPVERGFVIKNVGTFQAQSINVSIETILGSSQSGIVPSSMKLKMPNGLILPISSSTTDTFHLQECNRTVWKRASTQIPLIEVGESVELLFDVVACVPVCEQEIANFRGNFFYKKKCPVDGFISESALLLTPDGYLLGAQLSAEIGACLEDSTTYTFDYHVVSKYLLEDGFWQTKLTLPVGVTLDTNCLLQLGGVSPSQVEIYQTTLGLQVVSLAWQTPFLSDSLNMSLCLRYHCSQQVLLQETPTGDSYNQIAFTENCFVIPLKTDTYWSESLQTDTACAIHSCSDYLLNVNIKCADGGGGSPPDSFDLGGMPGYRTVWDAFRLNTGWADMDNDRVADLPLTPASEEIRRDLFLPGDTLQVHFESVVDSTIMIKHFQYNIGIRVFESDIFIHDNDSFLINGAINNFADRNALKLLDFRVRIKYADGSEITCDTFQSLAFFDRVETSVFTSNTFPAVPIDYYVSQNVSTIIKFANICGARPLIEKGDSVIIDSYFKLDFNFTPNSSNFPDPPLIGFRVFSSGENIRGDSFPYLPFQYSGWKRSITQNTHNIRPCEPSLEVEKFRYSMRIARENMFPFEVRPLAQITDYRQTLPVGITAQSCLLEYLTLQDSVIKITNMALPFTSNSGSLQVDYSSVFSEILDEGFTLRSKVTFEPNCLVPLPDSSIQSIRTQYEKCINGEINETSDTLRNDIGFFSSVPKVVLLSPDTSVLSPSRIFDISVILKNLVVGNAPAPWITLQNSSGLISGLQLIQMPQNQAINSTNGIYHLNELQTLSQQSFRITGQNTSCHTDSLAIIYGWDCSPISNLSEQSCFQDTLWITFVLQSPELELNIRLEPNPLLICDTSDYFEYEIFNAQNGYAYNLLTSVKLPLGLSIAPGSAQFSYPAGSPWVDIADPESLGAQFYQWDVNDLSAALNTDGLLGVLQFPENSFRIRFKTIAECGFVANTPIIYGVKGLEACGRETNTLNKPGEPLRIAGLDAQYSVQVNLDAQSGNTVQCGDEILFNFSLNINGTPGPQDSFYVVLPLGVSYSPGSYMPGLNAPSGPVTLNAQGFQIPLPTLGNTTVQGTFRVLIGPGAGCLDQFFVGQTRFKAGVFCANQGINCDVYVATGSDTWQYTPANPDLQPGNISFVLENGVLNGQVTLTNIGSGSAQGVVVEWWKDMDGNGVYSPADELIKVFSSTTTLVPGDSIVLYDILNQLDSNDLCGIILRIPADENCTCNSTEILLNDVNLLHSKILICNIQPLNVGVPAQNGFTYTWQPASGLACTTCSMTQFNPDDLEMQVLTLVASSATCTITHTFEILIGAAGEIIASDTVVCEGNTVVLSVLQQASSYEWQGPGIQNPTDASQTILPTFSSTYYLNTSFSNGCTASDSLFVAVLESDTVYLESLETCAGDSLFVLGELRATSGTYQLMSTKLNGCDSVLIQSLTVIPEPNTVEELRFCLGDSLLVLDSLFVESGTICRQYSSVLGCDSTHCVTITAFDPPSFSVQDTIQGTFGQIITLTGPNGYVTYLWEPDPEPPCVNCPSVTYPLDTTGLQEYRLMVQDTNGCSGALTFRVLVFPPCSADSLYIPNAFTPNGDGANDFFRVVEREGGEVVSSLEIYNRWGQKVYENRVDSVWDGRINGELASSDVYVYIVTVICGDLVGKRVGDVTLLR